VISSYLRPWCWIINEAHVLFHSVVSLGDLKIGQTRFLDQTDYLNHELQITMDKTGFLKKSPLMLVITAVLLCNYYIRRAVPQFRWKIFAEAVQQTISNTDIARDVLFTFSRLIKNFKWFRLRDKSNLLKIRRKGLQLCILVLLIRSNCSD